MVERGEDDALASARKTFRMVPVIPRLVFLLHDLDRNDIAGGREESAVDCAESAVSQLLEDFVPHRESSFASKQYLFNGLVIQSCLQLVFKHERLSIPSKDIYIPIHHHHTPLDAPKARNISLAF